MQSSDSERDALNQVETPDEEYDVVNYNEELSDDEGEQRAREGQLLQLRPHPPRNLYNQAMSTLMKVGDMAESSLRKGDVPDPVRRLVSHEYVNIPSPEEVTFFRLQVSDRIRKIKEYASVNVKAIESLCAKVPVEQAVVSRQIAIIRLYAELIQCEAEKMEDCLEVFKNTVIFFRRKIQHDLIMSGEP